MPARIPVDAQSVQADLTRYLDDPWVPVIKKDVDGPNSLPLALDRNNPNLGRYSACLRVARTLYLGSAPTLNTIHRGLEDNRIKLGCVQPGETVATFGDAIRRLTDQATHLYIDKNRYWFSTRPSVTRLAQDRAGQFSADEVQEKIRERLRNDVSSRGDFSRVHVCPTSGADVPDEREARLAVLDPESAHSARAADSVARRQAQEILDQRGQSPRLYRNTLVFLAPDKTRLGELEQAVRQHLAWDSIMKESETLNLDRFQTNQVDRKCREAEETMMRRIPETYQWLLVPTQPNPQGALEWEEMRLHGDEPLATRAGKKLINQRLMASRFAPTLLRIELDRIPLRRGDHVGVKQLCDDFAQYLYLPRLKDRNVLLNSIRDGLSFLTWERETFAYAEGCDEQRKRYHGLRAGNQMGGIAADGSGIVVKPEAALSRLRDQEQPTGGNGGGEVDVPGGGAGGGVTAGSSTAVTGGRITEPPPHQARIGRFHGVADLDATRLGRDAGTIAEAVIQHLAGLVGANVEVTLEIHAELPEGAPDATVRTVTENCRTLRFKSFGFEAS